MSKYLVRYQNPAGDYIGYDVEAESVGKAWEIGTAEFENDDPAKTQGYELEGVYSYEQENQEEDYL